MPDRTCSIEGCTSKVQARGWCSMHYTRWRRTGDPSPEVAAQVKGDDRRRFWSKANRADGCWEWSGTIDVQGYGVFAVDSHPRSAHRYSYELLVGPIPEGLQIDHLCRNRRCVNPDHLEAVTAKVNTLRSTAPSAVNAAKTHCTNGHEFTPENTYVSPRGWRKCRSCAAEFQRAYVRRKAG
jgi:hypothetical protein